MGATAGAQDHVDVLIIGAGISGLGAAYYLQRDHPRRSYAILEARGASGGTWDLFRYPGIRSDSDLHTFGYEFRPWRSDVVLADGEAILGYVRDTAAEHGVDRHVRYHARALAASWSSADARWTVDVEDTETAARSTVSCRWLFCATGYYRYDEGFNPHFEGRDRFPGPIVHPQQWPADLDYAGKRVVVIGSGATAVTLIPAMAASAGHITMLQRTPSYVLPVPSRDKLNARLTRLLGFERSYPITRWLNSTRAVLLWRFCQKWPRAARKVIRDLNVKMLPDGFPVDEHFNPPYNPWDQRMCMVPDGDLFRVIRDGKASVVTGPIETFTEDGVLLADGRTVDADIIITATGLNVQPFGAMTLTVDGAPVHVPDLLVYKGMMLSGVPNFAFVFGYTNNSWTLKVGLVGEHFARLLSHMDVRGYDTARPVAADPAMPSKPFTDFQSGYIRRALDQFPRQGTRAPWLVSPTYTADVKLLRRGPVDDPELRFETANQAREAAVT
jgi:cation diffusion facilitator CzcD-associated flavoprotein CzcO